MSEALKKIFYIKYDGYEVKTFSVLDSKLLNSNLSADFIYEIIERGNYIYPKLNVLKNSLTQDSKYYQVLHDILVQMHEVLWESFGINLSPYTLFKNETLDLFGKRIPIFHNRQITSFGGGGTSTLCHFAENNKNEGIRFPIERSHLPWKHIPSPLGHENYILPDDFKVVYILNNPIDALMSIFRRNFQNLHPHNVMKSPQDFIKRIRFFPKELAADFRLYTDIKWKFQDYIKHQEDLWQISEHCKQWTQKSATRNYPIMLIKYDSIWDNLDHIFKFLNLPSDSIDTFPAKTDRNSSYKNLSTKDLTDALNVYGNLVSYIDNLPNISQI